MIKSVAPTKQPPSTCLYHIHITLNEPMLGTAPASPEVYAEFVASKKFAASKELAKKGKLTEPELTALAAEQEILTREEIAMLPEEDKGVTVFRRSPQTKQLILVDHMIRGAFKEAASAIGMLKEDGDMTNWGLASKVDKWIFCTDGVPLPGMPGGKPVKMIPIMRNGAPIMAPEPIDGAPNGILQRPLRAQTMQGMRVTLAASEVIAPGAELDFFLYVLPLGQSRITREVIESWLNYWEFVGLGQWRSGGCGRCSYTLEAL
jgi:hypothetical protein